jgi:hypothetical protein
MAQTLLFVGLACLIAAIVGGGLTAFQVQLPALQSTLRQVMLGVVGLSLIGSSIFIQSYPKPGAQGAPAAPASSTSVASATPPPPVAATVAPAPQPQASVSPASAPVARVRAPASRSEGAPQGTQNTASETTKGVPRPSETRSAKSPAAPVSPEGAPGNPQIIIAGVRCRTTGNGFSVEAYGSARAAPGEPGLFYAEVGGSPLRPICVSWPAATAGSNPRYRFSCLHDPNSPVSTEWKLLAESGVDRPTTLFMGLLRPGLGKSFITSASRSLNCP